VGRPEVHLPSDWPTASHAAPSRYEGQTLGGRVRLDGASFERCEFRKAVLIYAGGVPPRIANCSFTDTRFEFQDAAGRTLAFLQAMAAPTSGLSAVFKASFSRLFGH
jgi:hypothetical protein